MALGYTAFPQWEQMFARIVVLLAVGDQILGERDRARRRPRSLLPRRGLMRRLCLLRRHRWPFTPWVVHRFGRDVSGRTGRPRRRRLGTLGRTGRAQCRPTRRGKRGGPGNDRRWLLRMATHELRSGRDCAGRRLRVRLCSGWPRRSCRAGTGPRCALLARPRMSAAGPTPASCVIAGRRQVPSRLSLRTSGTIARRHLQTLANAGQARELHMRCCEGTAEVKAVLLNSVNAECKAT